jgi:hypothetical protein
MTQVSDILDRLDGEWTRLEHAWSSATAGWQDQAQRLFLDRHWTAIDAETRVYRGLLADLGAVLDQARRSVQ